MPLGAAKRLIPHEQRRKRTGVASSKLGNLAFHLTLAFYVVNKWPIHIRPTNGPWKKTHLLNVELVVIRMYGTDSDPGFSMPKQT